MGVPFECDMCQFRYLNERDPINGNSKDNYTLLCIRREILDAFWSQETSTILDNCRRLRIDYFDSADALSIRRPVPTIGTDKVRDRVVMESAICNLDASQIKVSVSIIYSGIQ